MFSEIPFNVILFLEFTVSQAEAKSEPHPPIFFRKWNMKQSVLVLK